jgi:acetyl esterase/lipase
VPCLGLARSRQAARGSQLVPQSVKCRALVAGSRVPCEWLSTQESRNSKLNKVIFYVHPGSHCWMGGSRLVQHRAHMARLSAYTACDVLAVDYRLAPGTPFPGALHDCVRAYRWLASRVDSQRIIVMGDSSGAALALAMVQALLRPGDAASQK